MMVPQEFTAQMVAAQMRNSVGGPMQQSQSSSSVMDYCQGIQQEFQFLERQLTATKVEAHQLKQQKLEIQEHYNKSHSMLIKANREIQRQVEINTNLSTIISGMMEHLPEEARNTLRDQLDRLKSLTSEDFRSRMEYGQPHEDENDSMTKKQKITGAMNPPPPPSSFGMAPQEVRAHSSFDDRYETTPTSSPPSLMKSPNMTSSFSNPNSSSMLADDKKKKGLVLNNNVKRPKTPTKGIGNEFTQELSNVGIPRSARLINTLPHGEVVCAVAINAASGRIFTGGKGSVKLWDLHGVSKNSKYLTELRCLNDSYIRSCKVTSNGRTLIAAGETNAISIWDVGGSPMIKNHISFNSPACYAICINQEETGFFSCHSDGSVISWDMNTGKQIRNYIGHTDGVSCVDVSPDGSKFLTGGLDGTVRVWDIGTGKELGMYQFPSQIFSMGVCPGESWIAVGLESSHVEVLNLMNSNCKYQLHLHESCVLSMKFANSGKWFVTAGKDKMLNTWRSPFGSTLFQDNYSLYQCREPNSILCCDISAEDNYIVTGSGERLASVYEVLY